MTKALHRQRVASDVWWRRFVSDAAVSAVVSALAGAVLDAAPRGAARVAEIGAAYAALSEVE